VRGVLTLDSEVEISQSWVSAYPAVYQSGLTNMNHKRRDVMGMLALLGAMPSLSLAQQKSLLPLDTPGLDHFDIIVPDVEKSARFYMGLFRTALHAQPFRGAQRYFILLGPLPDNRRVGYLAIGASNGRGTYIGHFCTSVVNNSAAVTAQMKEQFLKAGLGEFPGGGGGGGAGTFKDPDGIEIQFLPSPDTLVPAAVPSDLVPPDQIGVIEPQRVDRVLLRVSNLQKALAYYRILYGKESRSDARSAVFSFRNGSQIQMEEVTYAYGGGGPPRIARFGIFVKPFDHTAAAATIAKLGGKVVQDEAKVLRLQDPDGVELELVSG
jgi:catechol 2,3-dioxygenase-like lactoylglutathione lyase family enzyme